MGRLPYPPTLGLRLAARRPANVRSVKSPDTVVRHVIDRTELRSPGNQLGRPDVHGDPAGPRGVIARPGWAILPEARPPRSG